MKKCLLILLPVLIFSSCDQPNGYLCTCEYKNQQTGIKATTIDTIRNLSEADAELECSNYETTDDPDESIICKLSATTIRE